MNWVPNTGEKPEGEVLICDGRAAWLCEYEHDFHAWYDNDDSLVADDTAVTHWMKVEAPK